jgi:DNA-binding SARP family transcriptional activator/WD40 repeat protein
MRIAVVGPLEVHAGDGSPVSVPGVKERLLLATLAAGAPGAVSADRLVDVLWDGAPPATARKTLQAHVVHLRSALEPGRPRGSPGRYVVRRGGGYGLAVERPALDSLHIGDLAARGRAELAAGSARDAERLLAAAVQLWRGEPFADWPDAAFAEPERRRLVEVRAGAVAGLLEARLALGRHPDVVPELERLVVEEPLREDWWRLLALALYRAGRQADALAALRRARGLLAAELGADPGSALREMEAAVLAQDPELELVAPAPLEPAALAGTMAVPACPYKGLAAYEAADAPLFHGRTRLVAGLVARLVDAPVLVVSGPSGAGKSSVVRAGLVPALAAGALPGSATWRPVVVTPGRRPVDALASLTGEVPPSAPVLLVCDQAEELWAPGVDPAERAAFLDTLLGLVDDGVVRRCVLVVRGDHVGRLAEHAAFVERLGAALLLVPAQTESELRQVVTEPARAVGATVEPELVDVVVADVHGRPAALPLLSTALVGTWERRRGTTLTLAGYLQAGGVAGALTRTAEDAWSALDAPDQEAARRLLVRLADVDDGGALVRRPGLLAELAPDPRRRTVVEAFVRRRLLSVDGDRVDVTHEALLTAWPRLTRWLEDDAASRLVRQHLGPAARDWAAGGRPDDELYRGARLAAALEWAAGADTEPTPTEGAFLSASREHADADLSAAQARAEREALARRRTRRLAQGLAAVLVLALVATGLAVGYQRSADRRAAEADRASTVADANRLAAQSTTAGTLDTALLLAAQAVRLADTPDTEDALLAALVEHDRVLRAVPFPGQLQGGTLGDGGRMLFLGVGEQIATWSVGPDALPKVLAIPDAWLDWTVSVGSPTEPLMAVAGRGGGRPWLGLFTADGDERPLLEGDDVGGAPLDGAWAPDGRSFGLLVAAPGPAPGSSSWQVVTVDVADGAHRASGVAGTVPTDLEALSADVSDDGRTAVLWSADGTPATLVDLADGSQVQLPAAPRTAADPPYRALPSGVAQLWADGGVTRFDERGVAVQDLDAHRAAVRDVVVAPDGTWAVTAGDAGAVVRWQVDPASGLWSQPEPLVGHSRDVVDAAVDPAGRTLFTASLDDTVITWDMGPDAGRGSPFPGLADRWMSNRPQFVDPDLLVVPTRPVSLTDDAPDPVDPATLGVVATFLDPGSGRVVAEVPMGETLPGTLFGSSVAVSPDRSRVAVTWGLGTTVLDARSREVVAELVLPPNGGGLGDQGPLPATAVWSSAWSPDGSRLFLGAEGDVNTGLGGDLAVVDPVRGRVDRRVDIGVTPQVIEPSPDGRSIAVASGGTPEVVVLDARTLEVQHTVQLATEELLFDLAFSPDGAQLAGVGHLGGLHLLDTATWEPVGEPVPVHADSGLQVEWLRDGRSIATTGLDGTVSLFDADRGQVRARPMPATAGGGPGHTYLVPGPADELATFHSPQAGRRYALAPRVWLREACAIVGRDLTDAEWSRYLPDRSYAPTCSDLS